MSNADASSAAFELFVSGFIYNNHREPNRIECWQASRQAALNEAMAICDEECGFLSSEEIKNGIKELL